MRAAQGWHRLMNDGVNPRLIGLASDAPLTTDEIAQVVNRLRKVAAEG